MPVARLPRGTACRLASASAPRCGVSPCCVHVQRHSQRRLSPTLLRLSENSAQMNVLLRFKSIHGKPRC